MNTNPLPLSGIRVLELSHTIMGPCAGMVLADMGADVIKIEPTPNGEETRRLKGFGCGFFPYFNRNKTSLAVDLKREQGKTIVYRLMETADILIENYAPDTLDRLGLGYEKVREINPRLIYCSLKGFMPGPYEKRPALDEVCQMMGGLAYMTGPTDRPLRAGSSVVDILGGSFGVIGILAALTERQRTGRGQFVTATLFESVALLMAQHMAVAAITGETPLPMPTRGRTWAIYDLFQLCDSQIFLGITSDRHWLRFCQTFGYADLAADERLKTNQGRLDQRDWLLPELTRRLGELTRENVEHLAAKANIPFAPVANPADLFEDPHLNSSGALMKTPLAPRVTAKMPKIPLRMDGRAFDLQRPAPTVGEGGRQLLSEIGLSGERIARLQAEGVIGPLA
jgi:crotonobetainyl-CoA:carnitine CoA-transferase CaiB-like acyl-CoA transferase